MKTRLAEYVYAENMVVGPNDPLSAGAPVIVLHLNLQDDKPLSRLCFNIDSMRQLKEDLERVLMEYDERAAN